MISPSPSPGFWTIEAFYLLNPSLQLGDQRNSKKNLSAAIHIQVNFTVVQECIAITKSSTVLAKLCESEMAIGADETEIVNVSCRQIRINSYIYVSDAYGGFVFRLEIPIRRILTRITKPRSVLEKKIFDGFVR